MSEKKFENERLFSDSMFGTSPELFEEVNPKDFEQEGLPINKGVHLGQAHRNFKRRLEEYNARFREE
ncbi:MAG: hypothetical protein HQL56_18765 [Magnetococcales bacterium]|nr:hypothetical protein [Magnetococcales bacterium]